MTLLDRLALAALVGAMPVRDRAAAAEPPTAAALERALAVRPDEPPTFRADHPFVLMIRHNPTGAILFLARVSDPTP